jgi:hypothetical protein
MEKGGACSEIRSGVQLRDRLKDILQEIDPEVPNEDQERERERDAPDLCETTGGCFETLGDGYR